MSNLPLTSIMKAKNLKKQELKKFWKYCIEKEIKAKNVDNFVILPPLIMSVNDLKYSIIIFQNPILFHH